MKYFREPDRSYRTIREIILDAIFGSLLIGKRKSKRPISTQSPLHLVLKSDLKGVFNPGNRRLEKRIRSLAQKFNLKIYDLALNWSHIHCVIRIKDRGDYNAFVRALTGTIALKIRKSIRDIAAVFTLRPFTRILSWGRDFKNALNYQVLNQLEAWGLIQRASRPKERVDSNFKIEKQKKKS